MKTIQIPLDERTGKPLVTSAMKAACIGEIDYVDQITVPWDTCKKIYKAMVLEAAKEMK